MSQSQSGWPSSQTSYPSSAWWAFTPTNYLMGREPLSRAKYLSPLGSTPKVVCGISSPFGLLSPTQGQVTHVLLSRSPLCPLTETPFDLHVLGTPPAFVLSQDQTLRLYPSPRKGTS